MKIDANEVIDQQLGSYHDAVYLKEAVELLEVLGESHLPRQESNIDYTLYRLILLLMKRVGALENSSNTATPLTKQEEK